MLDHMLEIEKTDTKNLLLNISPMRHSFYKGACISASLIERERGAGWLFWNKNKKYCKAQDYIKIYPFSVPKLGQTKQ